LSSADAAAPHDANTSEAREYQRSTAEFHPHAILGAYQTSEGFDGGFCSAVAVATILATHYK
jgi:hypothetical protein